jgi:hypothetical protein
MKAKKTVTRKPEGPPARPSEPSMFEYMKTLTDPLTGLPEPPLISVDIQFPIPDISQEEVLRYFNARRRFLIAKLDYERKRSDLVLRLQMLARVQPGSYSARLAKDDETVIITEAVSAGVSTVIKENPFKD